MQRRHFLQSLGLTASGLLAPITSAWADQTEINETSTPSLFRANPKLTFLRGLQGQDIQIAQARIVGKLPPSLRGNFFRNGPGLFERGDQRYHHWFDGDGMVHA